jgi:hypothetical protein
VTTTTGESDQPLGCAPQYTQAVALRRIAGQLVQLIRDGKVEPSPHVPANVLNRRHALNAVAIRLPECGIVGCSAMRQSQGFGELDLVDKVEMGELLALRVHNRGASVGIDDAPEIRSGFRLEVGMFPVVTQLPLVLASNEEGWS